MVGVSMNEVDYLLSCLFSAMSLEEKLEVKRLGIGRVREVFQYAQED